MESQKKQWEDNKEKILPPPQGSQFEGDVPEPAHTEAEPLSPMGTDADLT